MLLYKSTQRQQNKKYKQINEKKVINNENCKFLKNDENSEENSSVYPKIGENNKYGQPMLCSNGSQATQHALTS